MVLQQLRPAEAGRTQRVKTNSVLCKDGNGLIDDLARPEVFKTALGRRLREVRRLLGDPEREAFAETLGVSARALATYERGDNEPSMAALSAYRDTHGIDLNWLLSAQGEMFADPSKAPTIKPALNADLMERLARIVTSVYREAGHKLSSEKVAVEAAGLYNDLLRRIDDLNDMEEIETALPQLKYHLKKRLNDAVTEPGTGKRSA